MLLFLLMLHWTVYHDCVHTGDAFCFTYKHPLAVNVPPSADLLG